MSTKVSKKAATRKNGRLKKGYKYAKGGRIVKAKKACGCTHCSCIKK